MIIQQEILSKKRRYVNHVKYVTYKKQTSEHQQIIFLNVFLSDKMQHISTGRQNKQELKETDREKERERQTESQTDKERERE